MAAWILVAALALAPPPSVETPPVVPPPQAAVMAVPADLRAHLMQSMGDAAPPALRLERLAGFLFGADGLDMAYQHDATLTVAEAYAARKANCLTFTLLTVALARELGLEASGQEVRRALAWHEKDNTIYHSNHVNTVVVAGQRRFAVDVAGDSVILREAPRRIEDDRLLSLYYGNRAVELNAGGDHDAAAAHMAIALRLSPDDPGHRSNAGVLHLRRGDRVAAERDYLHALELDPVHGAALFNVVVLYQRSGDPRAAQYQRRLERARRRDPFHHFLLALEKEKRGDYAGAVRHYRSAIRLHGDEHRFHFGLARAYLQLGKARRAGRELERARDLGNADVRARYQAKLDRLRR